MRGVAFLACFFFAAFFAAMASQEHHRSAGIKPNYQERHSPSFPLLPIVVVDLSSKLSANRVPMVQPWSL
jgi:hypothetical protein